MSFIRGKMLEDSAITTAKLAAGALAASAAGRAKMATGLFDSATVTDKFADTSIALAKLAEAVIQADGGQAFTADQSIGGFKLTNLGAPTASGDAATKSYVDAISAGLDPKGSVRVATAAALPTNTRTANVLTASANGALNDTGIDGVTTLALNDRVLVKNEVTGANNGIYYASDLGSAGTPWTLTRATDADTSAEVTAGMFCPVEEGTANADRLFLLTTNNPITLNTTALVFSSFGELQLGATPNTIEPDDAAAEGSSTKAARADHEHAIVCAAPGTTAKSEATGASEGSATSFMRTDAQIQVATASPGTTVKSEATAAAQGSSSSLLRADAQIQAATAAPSAVGTANAQGSSSSLARADHIHDSPAPTTSNKNMTASVTAADAAKATATTVASTPALDGYVQVHLNGIMVQVGDTGTFATSTCYFGQGDTTTGRAIADIASGDTLRWNGSVAGYELDATDRIDFDYLV